MTKTNESGWQGNSGPYVNEAFPYDRLQDATPTLHEPAAVLSEVAGTQMTGVLVTINAVTSIATLNIARGFKSYQSVRNVLTYAQAAEATFRTLNVGTPLYYDRSATMPATCKLSCSPLDNTGAANPLWGYVCWSQTETPDPFRGDSDPYPLGSAIAGVTHTDICVLKA